MLTAIWHEESGDCSLYVDGIRHGIHKDSSMYVDGDQAMEL